MNTEYCNECGLCSGTKNPCLIMPSDNDAGGLMVVSDYPSTYDNVKGTFLKGQKDQLFWKTFKEVVGGDESKIHVSYAVKCGGHEGKFKKDQLKKCVDYYLFEEIKRVRPDTILLLGKTPALALGFEGALKDLRGQVYPYRFVNPDGSVAHTTKVIITYPPAYIEYSSNLLPVFSQDVERALTGVFADKTDVTKHVQVTKMEQVYKLVEYIHQTKLCVFDFETTLLTKRGVFDPEFKATLLSISFQHGSAWTIPLFHFESPFTPDECMEILQFICDEVWNNPEIRKGGHNLKFDMKVAARYVDAKFYGKVDDTLIMHHYYNENLDHGLKQILPTYYPAFAGWELALKPKEWNTVELARLAPYAAVDSDGTNRLKTVLEKLLLEDERVYWAYRNHAMAAIKTLFRMEMRGALVDRENLIKYIERAEELLSEQEDVLREYRQVKRYEVMSRHDANNAAIQELEEKILNYKQEKYKVIARTKISNIKTGITDMHEPVNFGSPDQLSNLLYSINGFGFAKPKIRKKRSSSQSEKQLLTGKVALLALNDTTGFVKDLMTYRAIATNLKTFLRAILANLDSNDRIHSEFNLAGTVTLRLSSKNINFQNISKHVKVDHPSVKETVSLVTKCFIPPPGHVILQADFSQLELRLVAEFANETVMLEAYAKGQDLHALTASKMMGLILEEFYQLPKDIQKKNRNNAKPANFGLLYGQEAAGFREYANNNYGLSLTLEEATTIRTAFFKAYPNLLAYHSEYRSKVAKFKHVRTLLGTKRRLPDIDHEDEYWRAAAEREAINSPIQGTGGLLTVLALTLLECQLPSRVILWNSVHDSIAYYVPYDLIPYAANVIRNTMCNLPLKQFFGKELTKVALEADIEISKNNWKELLPYNRKQMLVGEGDDAIPLHTYLNVDKNCFKK